MSRSEQRCDWLEQLLVDEATQGLGPLQEEELELLARQRGLGERDRNAYQRAAAAIELAFARLAAGASGPPIPLALERRLHTLARSCRHRPR